MPEIEFRTGLSDKIGYACRWLHKAYERGAGVHVLGEAADLWALDRELWVAEERGFLPHALLGRPGADDPGHAQALREFTPVWLGPLAQLPPLPPRRKPALLLNLGEPPPADAGPLAAYERVIELVGTDSADAQAGRQRWRAYLALGLTPHHLALGLTPHHLAEGAT
jgi:DNA polymerase III subunit chi